MNTNKKLILSSKPVETFHNRILIIWEMACGIKPVKRVLALSLLLFIASLVTAADRYWIANTNSNWNNVQNWSDMAGGVPGASVPGFNDKAIFEYSAGKGSGNCSADGAVNVLGIHIKSSFPGYLQQLTYPLNIGSLGCEINGGTFQGGSGTTTIKGNLTIAGGIFYGSSSLMDILGNMNMSSGVFVHNNGKVRISSASTTGTYTWNISGLFIFNNLEFFTFDYSRNLICNINPQFPIAIQGELLFSGGGSGGFIQLNYGILNASGNITVTNLNPDGVSGGTAFLNIIGSGNQMLTGAGSPFRGQLPQNIHINKPSGTLFLKNTITVSGHWIIDPGNAGIIDGTTYNSTLSFFIKTFLGSVPGANISGSFTVGSLFFPTGGTVAISPGTEITVANSLNLSATNFASNRLTINTGKINVKGDIYMNNTSSNAGSGGNGTININGTGNQMLKGSGGRSRGPFPNIIIDKPSGTLTLSSIIVMAAGTTWDHRQGIVNSSSNQSEVVFSTGCKIKSDGSLNGMKFHNVALGYGCNSSGTDITMLGNMIVSNNLNFNPNAGLIRLMLNQKGLIIENPATTAISAPSGTGIASDDQSILNQVSWNISGKTGAYVVPFITSSNISVPCTLSVTTAGSPGGHFVFSTYSTLSDSTMSGYPDSSMNFIDNNGVDVSDKIVFRFWTIDARNYSLPPVSNITFTYQQSGSANEAPSTITESALHPYYWCGVQWQEMQTGMVDPITNIVEAVAVNQYSYWILAEKFDPRKVMLTDIAIADTSCTGKCNHILNGSAFGGTAPYVFAWSNELGSGQTIGNVCAGTYTVTATDAKGCISEKTIPLIQPDSMIVSIAKQDGICSDLAGGSASVTVSGGTPGYTYNWNTGATSDALNNLENGSYCVTVADAKGCVSYSDTFTITVVNKPVVDAGLCRIVYLGYPALGCNEIIPYITDGTPPYSYLWNTGSTSTSITVCPSAGTSYLVTVTDANGCEGSDAVSVSVVDVRCGKNNDKVQICHLPPGNPQNTQQLCISASAVPAHLAHGDYLGQCGMADPCFTAPAKMNGSGLPEDEIIYENLPDISAEENIGPLLVAFPNPFMSNTKIVFSISKTVDASLSIYNILGEKLDELYNDKAIAFEYYKTRLDAAHYQQGVYYGVLRYEDKSEMVRLMVIHR